MDGPLPRDLLAFLKVQLLQHENIRHPDGELAMVAYIHSTQAQDVQRKSRYTLGRVLILIYLTSTVSLTFCTLCQTTRNLAVYRESHTIPFSQ